MIIKQYIKEALPDEFVMRMKSFLNKYNNDKMLKKYKNIISFNSDIYPFGINLIGDIRAETGLGQSMRILAQMLTNNDIPFCIMQVDSPGGLEHNDSSWEGKITKQLKYSINIIHINFSIWAESYNSFANEVLDYRYNIAYWLWELEEIPVEWIACMATIDEIWVPSNFIYNCIKKKTNKVLRTVPYIINVDEKDLYGRNHFGLPQDKFLFLTMYDFKSISERKNPKAVIEAYKKTFTEENENVGLVIKVNHMNNRKKMEELKNSLLGYKNIYYITDNLTRKEIESLIACVHVFVSLHRSEGFGLPMAEAMYLGVPVIATNWSANTEFMNEDSSCLVDYKLVELDKNIGPYKKGNRWAEANIHSASLYMKRLYEDEEYYKMKSIYGKKYVCEKLSGEKALECFDYLKQLSK